MDGCTVFLNVSDVNIKTQGHLGKHLGTTPVINAVGWSFLQSSEFCFCFGHSSSFIPVLNLIKRFVS